MASASDNPSVAADVHLIHLLGTNCAGQLHYDSPLHPVSPVFLIRRVVPRSERDPHFSDGLGLKERTDKEHNPEFCHSVTAMVRRSTSGWKAATRCFRLILWPQNVAPPAYADQKGVSFVLAK